MGQLPYIYLGLNARLLLYRMQLTFAFINSNYQLLYEKSISGTNQHRFHFILTHVLSRPLSTTYITVTQDKADKRQKE